MIETLRIRSLGVIEAADLEFGPGLTVLTGETGTGKTMVLTSLQLLLGGRADPAVVRTGAERTEVDGTFGVPEDVAALARSAGADVEDDELIVSRTVAARGRSRAHLGGRPVPAQILARVGESLVTVHGQADQMRLRQPSVQRETLDAFGDTGHRELLSAYHEAWERAVAARERRDVGLESAQDREAEIGVLTEATEAIAALDPQEGEDEDLRSETERLMNVEDLRSGVGAADAVLAGDLDDPGALDLLQRGVESLRAAARLDPALDALADQLARCTREVDAVRDETNRYLNALTADPVRLAQVHERRAALRELLVGRAADATGLLAWQRAALARLDELTGASSDPAELERLLRSAQEEVLRAGRALADSRAGLAARLTRCVDDELAALAMKGAHLTISFESRKPSSTGTEDVMFLLQPHPDAPARPLGQGASGGELSRVMLALEVVLGERGVGGTFVFDEVDAGIGGRTATEVGLRLARLARSRQVIVVTHLAQVAAFADGHIVVEKDGSTTRVRSLTGDARIGELARMLGGDASSEAARRHAVELREAARVPQSKP